jgi:uncharacterized protein (DUF433 family)
MLDPSQTSHIEIRDSARGERAFVRGHRIRVQDIVLWDEEGLSPDEIVTRVPTLGLSDVYAALAYYYDHQPEMDQQIRDDEMFASASEHGLLDPKHRQP